MPQIEKCARRVIEQHSLQRIGKNIHQVTKVYDSNCFFLGSTSRYVRPLGLSETTAATVAATPRLLGLPADGGPLRELKFDGPTRAGQDSATYPTTVPEHIDSSSLGHSPGASKARIRDNERRLETLDGQNEDYIRMTSGTEGRPCSLASNNYDDEPRMPERRDSTRFAVDDFYGLEQHYATVGRPLSVSDSVSETGMLTPSRMSTPTFLREEERLVAAGYYDLKPCIAHQTRECFMGLCPGCASPSLSTTSSLPEEPVMPRNPCGWPPPSAETIRRVQLQDEREKRIIQAQVDMYRNPFVEPTPDYDGTLQLDLVRSEDTTSAQLRRRDGEWAHIDTRRGGLRESEATLD